MPLFIWASVPKKTSSTESTKSATVSRRDASACTAFTSGLAVRRTGAAAVVLIRLTPPANSLARERRPHHPTLAAGAAGVDPVGLYRPQQHLRRHGRQLRVRDPLRADL